LIPCTLHPAPCTLHPALFHLLRFFFPTSGLLINFLSGLQLKSNFLVSILALLIAGSLHAEELRSWKDLQNRTVEARMVGLEGESVILEMKDGRKIPFPLAKLSPEDAEYARSRKTAEKAGPAKDLEPNFNLPWPERIKFSEDPAIVTVQEDAEEKIFIYESTNYRYNCDVRLSKSVVKGFAVMFEATYLFCRSLPIALDGGVRTNGKLQIHLFENFDDYVKAGGPAGTAGVFISGKHAVMVPLTSLGVRAVGSSYMLDRDKSSKTLPHELTHQLTAEPYFKAGSRGWFTEGIAEYVAVTPYRSGSFAIKNNHKDIIDYATGYGSKDEGGRALGKEIAMIGLKDFMLQDYDAFTANAQLNYGCGLLITYYFLQMDGDGDGKRIKAFLKALRGGKTGEDALAVLKDGRSYEQLEKEISKAWSRRGIELTFGTGK
jgi:hypothetical protein